MYPKKRYQIRAGIMCCSGQALVPGRAKATPLLALLQLRLCLRSQV